jgi:putative phosphoribosyl transferase
MMNRPETHELVTIRAGSVQLDGISDIPKDAKGIVLFAHGSGSSRYSPRNQYVASILRSAGCGTLLFDLLTAGEANDRSKVFDINLLVQRLQYATEWIGENFKDLKIGYFGSSTGAAAALQASVETDAEISALVSRGGRPDIIMTILDQVKAPTLLIVGGNDFEVLRLNRLAYEKLWCEKELKLVPGATHLFEEPGKLQEVADLAALWFTKHFRQPLELW